MMIRLSDLRAYLVILYPFQGLRIIDTFPFLLLLGSIGKEYNKKRLGYLILGLFYLISGLFLAKDYESFLRISSCILLLLLYPFFKNYQVSVNVDKIINVLLALVLVEDLLIGLGFLSPLVRDPDGAIFIFREKSYAAICIFFLYTIIPRAIKPVDILKVFIFVLFLKSMISMLLLVMLVFNIISRRRSKYFQLLPVISIPLMYLLFWQFFGYIMLYVEYSDSLRFLINLSSGNGLANGTIFIHNIESENRLINLSDAYFSEWSRLTAQSIFFNFYSFFGLSCIPFIIGIILATLKFSKPADSKFYFFVFFVMFHFFVQGFLFSPYILYYLANMSKYDES